MGDSAMRVELLHLLATCIQTNIALQQNGYSGGYGTNYVRQDGSPATEAELRAWAMRLYREQPMTPATSRDEEFNMGGHKTSVLNQLPPSTLEPGPGRAPSALSFLDVWKVLDLAARSNHMGEAVEAHMDVTEGALLSALIQRFPRRAPIVCLAGFHAGHSSIVWLESNPAVRLVAFDEFRERHQRGGRAFIESLFPRRLIPLAGQAATTAKEMARARVAGTQCDVVHIDVADDTVVPILQAMSDLVPPSHVAVLTGSASSAIRENARGILAEGLACQVLKPPTSGAGMARRICIGHYGSAR